MTVDKTTLLKIDKDCFVSEDWIRGYVNTIIQICKAHGVEVIWIRICRSERKGLHFYIMITPAIDADQANYLQWLLGDDCQRVDFNRAGIQSNFAEWNKLFEVAERRPRTIYKAASGCFSDFSLMRCEGHGIRDNERVQGR
jgi:hypothetical protein